MTEVSIITPCYNSEQFIADTIESVLEQTFQNWEMIIVDDKSSDNSVSIVKEYSKKDKRIKLICLENNSGSPTIPRNKGISIAKGRFIAFLDSDDLWSPTKLEEQIHLFQENNVAIVFSNYEKIDEEGMKKNRIIKAPAFVKYKDLLKGNSIACSTAIYDSKKVGKIYFVNQRHEDYILWLSILKKGYIGKNSNTITTFYRVRKSSISANKIKVIKWTWNIYRKTENLSLTSSIFYMFTYLYKSLKKYMK